MVEKKKARVEDDCCDDNTSDLTIGIIASEPMDQSKNQSSYDQQRK